LLSLSLCISRSGTELEFQGWPWRPRASALLIASQRNVYFSQGVNWENAAPRVLWACLSLSLYVCHAIFEGGRRHRNSRWPWKTREATGGGQNWLTRKKSSGKRGPAIRPIHESANRAIISPFLYVARRDFTIRWIYTKTLATQRFSNTTTIPRTIKQDILKTQVFLTIFLSRLQV
jgi:hypothetical protein